MPTAASPCLMLLLLLAGVAGQSAAQQPPRATPDPARPDAGLAHGSGPAAPQDAAAPATDAPQAPATRAPDTPHATPGVPAPFVQELPGTLVRLELRPVGALWFGATEVTWDAYDVLVFGLDQAAGTSGTSAGSAAGAAASGVAAPAENGAADEEVRGPDAVLRPTKPHIVADRGFGHAGYPALSISGKGAQAFCAWLSAVSGRRYRLPTEAEWEAACRAGAPEGTAPDAAWGCGEQPGALAAAAWYRENSERKTHPVGTRAPDRNGLHDLHGNVAEWCVAADGSLVLKGGSYRDPAGALRIDARAVPVPAWNQSDPNLPKSVWWLADAPFAGFRIVCEDAAPSAPGAMR